RVRLGGYGAHFDPLLNKSFCPNAQKHQLHRAALDTLPLPAPPLTPPAFPLHPPLFTWPPRLLGAAGVERKEWREESQAVAWVTSRCSSRWRPYRASCAPTPRRCRYASTSACMAGGTVLAGGVLGEWLCTATSSTATCQGGWGPWRAGGHGEAWGGMGGHGGAWGSWGGMGGHGGHGGAWGGMGGHGGHGGAWGGMGGHGGAMA
ncbi:unnamed protein product, partial [Closterium sp. NIES-54]